MLFYFFLLCSMCVLEKCTRNTELVLIRRSGRQRLSFSVLLCFCVLLFFYTFRSSSVGWDTENYLRVFQSVDSVDIFHHWEEPGWLYLLKLVHKISASQQVFFCIIGTLSLLPVIFLIQKCSQDFLFSLVCYYMLGLYFNLMNQQRTSFATAICAMSFYLLYRGKRMPAFLLIFPAFLIHKSSLIFLVYLLFILCFKRLSKKIVLVCAVGTAFVFVFYDFIFGKLADVFFGQYLTESHLRMHNQGGNLKMFLVFLGLAAVLWHIYAHTDKIPQDLIPQDWNGRMDLREDGRNQDRLNFMLFTALLFSLMLQAISLKNAMIARFSNYFSIYLIILIPNTLYRLRNRGNRQIWKAAILSVLLVYMVIYLRFSENGFGRDGVIPYLMDFSR